MVRGDDLPPGVADEYRDGASLEWLALKHGCSPMSLRRLLLRQGVEIRPPLLPLPPQVELPLSVIDEYLAGATCRQLGDKYGCSKTKVMYFLHDHNVEMRPKPAAPPLDGTPIGKPRTERLAERVWFVDEDRWPHRGYWMHPDPPHGHGLDAYRNWGCRCRECGQAMYAWTRSRRYRGSVQA